MSKVQRVETPRVRERAWQFSNRLASFVRQCVAASAAAILLLAPAATLAATYYVGPSGLDTNPGTTTAPFKTLQKAANIVSPGDTVIVKDGVYTSASGNWIVSLSRSGTAASPITFKAEHRHAAILDGQNYTRPFGVVFWASHIRFDGFQLRNFMAAGLWMQANASGTVQTHDIVVANNWIHHIGRIVFSDCNGTTNPSGAYTNGWVHDVVWDSNLIHDVGRVPNLACDANLGTTPNYRHDHGLYLQGKYHTVINNIFYNMHAGWAIKVDGSYGALRNASDRSHTIINNTFAHSAVPRESAGHIRFFANNPPETDSGYTMNRPVNVLVENNISYNPPYWNGPGASSWGPTFIAALYDGVMNYTGTVVRNNVTTAGSVIDEASGGTAITSKVTLSNNRILTNPLLVDPANNNFKLQAGSPSRFSGNAPGHPPIDFAGVARPSTGPDIGAYQYASAGAPALVVTNPADGATLSGTSSVQVANNTSMTSIVLKIDANTVAQMAPPFSFSLDTRTLSNGSHILTAHGTDAGGVTYGATPVTVNVANTTDNIDVQIPTVRILSPAAGSVVNSAFTVDVAATDDSEHVTALLYIDGALVAASNTGTISYLYQSSSATRLYHTISAVARDVAGNEAATSIVVPVSNATGPDTTPPTATMSAPASGSTVFGTVTLGATASDNIGVTRVDFYVDTTLVGSAKSAPFQVSWNSATRPNGKFTLSARAFDAAGNYRTSPNIFVTASNATVPDKTPPRATMSAPANGSTVSGTVTLGATASDNIGVTRVDFYVDTTLVGSAKSAPFQVSWNSATRPNGKFTLSARAFDAAGNYRTSPNIFVVVSNVP